MFNINIRTCKNILILNNKTIPYIYMGKATKISLQTLLPNNE